MVFSSIQVTGKGRGKKIGVPTINLQIPPKFGLDEGIYAVWVFIESKTFRGAMHFGPVPVFNELRRSLEIYLLNTDQSVIPDLSNKRVTVRTVEMIRKIMNFKTPEAMVERIQKDVIEINQVLSKNP